MRNLILSIFLASAAIFSIQAQEPCGIEHDQEFMDHFMTKDMSYIQSGQGRAATQWVPIQYHIVGRDNGTGYFYTRDIVELHCSLNERMASSDIQFYMHDLPNYINNSNYFEFTSTWTGNAMMNQYNISTVCNVYIVEDPRGVCGYAFYPGSGPGGRGGIVLNKSCAGPGSTTLVHEMGHYLGLPHTFSGWEGGNPPSASQQERVNGSNCRTAADRFCDTPADFISDRWTCPFTGTETDLNGDLYRTVLDGTLYMSYANDGCHTRFSQEQITEMYTVLPTERPYLLNGPTITPKTLDTAILTSPSPGFAQLPANFVNLKWNAVPDADYYHVLVTRFLNPNQFNIDTIVSDTSVILRNLQGSYNYRWRVKALSKDNFCAGYSQESNFSTTNLTVEVNKFLPSCNGEDDGALGLEVYGATSPISYSWSNGINQNPQGFLGAGNYQVTVTDGANQTVILDIDLDEPEEIDIRVEPIGNGYLRASATGGVPPYVFEWPDGSTGTDWFAGNTGSYSVKLTDDNRCEILKSYSFTSIGESLENFSDLKLYPNPVNSGQSVKLEFTGSESEETILTVWSLDGREVLQEAIPSGSRQVTTEIPTAGFSPGMYMVGLVSGADNAVLRFSYTGN